MMLRVEYSSEAVSTLLPQILAIADADKEALGFLSPSAFQDACRQGRVIAAVEDGPETRVAGYVLFGGLYPHARVYQIGVALAHRRSGIASRLINFLVSKLESSAYLTLSAKVANDLNAAMAFYEANGFSKGREVKGGKARGRQLSIYSRTLRTDDLFSLADVQSNTEAMLAFAFRSSRTNDTPFYVIDLNVLFDLVKNRARSADARLLFGAALAHKIRIVISPEFLVELRRTSFKPADDAVLQMAMQLPQLAKPDDGEFDRIAKLVHHLAFESVKLSSAHSVQSWSDARHVAHAAVARASGYITSDGAVLAAKSSLRQQIGIDVASLSELVDLVADYPKTLSHTHVRGEGFEIVRPSEEEVAKYLSSSPVLQTFLSSGDKPRAVQSTSRIAVRSGRDLAAICILTTPGAPNAPSQMVLHPNPRVLDSASFLDALFDRSIAEATTNGPLLLELWPVPDESVGTVTAFARSRGFIRAKHTEPFMKAALGRPLTPTNWDATATALRRRTGAELRRPADVDSVDLQLDFPGREAVTLAASSIEDLLGPTIIPWSNRQGVIQPIARQYADDLLGTGHQHSFLESKEASFLSQRSYVSSPRSAKLMQPGAMIFFYESQRTGGRGAIVGVARIVESLVLSKEAVSHHHQRHLVVPDVARFTSGREVLLTSFDNLLVFPRPCTLSTLRSLDLVGTQNLQTTTALTGDAARRILDFGWASRAVG